MDKVDQQLAIIIQDIKSPTLDGLRAATVADGIGDMICGSICLTIFITIVVAVSRVDETKRRFLWFKGPFDKDEVNMFRLLGTLVGALMLLLTLFGLANPSTWLKVAYPDAIIAQRAISYH